MREWVNSVDRVKGCHFEYRHTVILNASEESFSQTRENAVSVFERTQRSFNIREGLVHPKFHQCLEKRR